MGQDFQRSDGQRLINACSSCQMSPRIGTDQVRKYLMTDLEMPPIHWQRSLYDSTDEGLDLILLSYVQMEVGLVVWSFLPGTS